VRGTGPADEFDEVLTFTCSMVGGGSRQRVWFWRSGAAPTGVPRDGRVPRRGARLRRREGQPLRALQQGAERHDGPRRAPRRGAPRAPPRVRESWPDGPGNGVDGLDPLMRVIRCNYDVMPGVLFDVRGAK